MVSSLLYCTRPQVGEHRGKSERRIARESEGARASGAPWSGVSGRPVHIDLMKRVLLLLSFLGMPAAAVAQVRTAPFETLDLSLAVLGDVNRGVLHRWWSPGPAVGFGMAAPFYLGILELGAQYAHPTAVRDDVPGFRSLFLYAGWGGAQPLGSGFAAGGGLRVGLMAMRFDGDSIPASRARESELGVAARAALRWMPAGSWFGEASVSYQSVFTHRRLEQVLLAAGIGRRFHTPEWLRDFLD
jgi:hypothetical protein